MLRWPMDHGDKNPRYAAALAASGSPDTSPSAHLDQGGVLWNPFALLTRLIAHDVLPVPSKSAGLRGTWRKIRDRREPLLTSIVGGWRGGCADLAETG